MRNLIVSLKVRVRPEEHKALKEYTKKNDTSIQRLLHDYIKKILEEERK